MVLRVAVPNKGSLSEAATTILSKAGYVQRRESRELVLIDPIHEVEFFYLRPRDIAVYVGEGSLDAGITGRDLLLDSRTHAQEIVPLGFGLSTFHFAGPVGKFKNIEGLRNMRVATSYEGLLQRYCERENISMNIVPLDGAVESAIRLGVADAVADVVSTGTTLRTAGLEIFGEEILRSEAVLIGRQGHRPPKLHILLQRLQGVLVAQDYVLCDYDVEKSNLDRALALTPGLESPTISPLHNTSWVAVRAMVKRREINQVMDSLVDVGARAVLVIRIEACRM